jgi:pilus assembly protein Flp/PilA
MSEALLRLYVTTTAWVQDRYTGRKDRGATAVEYGLLVGLIAVGIIVAVVALRDNLSGLFEDISGTLGNPAAAGTAE